MPNKPLDVDLCSFRAKVVVKYLQIGSYIAFARAGSIYVLLSETCVIRLSAQVSVKYNSRLGMRSSIDDLFIGKTEVGHLMDEMMHRDEFERLVAQL